MVRLINGEEVKLALLDIEYCQGFSPAWYTAANLRIAVDGEEVIIGSGNYNLPVL